MCKASGFQSTTIESASCIDICIHCRACFLWFLCCLLDLDYPSSYFYSCFIYRPLLDSWLTDLRSSATFRLRAHDDPVTSFTMLEELTSMFPRISVQRRRQYSVRPFYWSLVVFIVLAVFSFGLDQRSSSSAADGVSISPVRLLTKRGNEPEVLITTIFPNLPQRKFY